VLATPDAIDAIVQRRLAGAYIIPPDVLESFANALSAAVADCAHTRAS
jgi:hypothetical protein